MLSSCRHVGTLVVWVLLTPDSTQRMEPADNNTHFSSDKAPSRILITGAAGVGKKTLAKALMQGSPSVALENPAPGISSSRWTIQTKYYTVDVDIWATHTDNHDVLAEATPSSLSSSPQSSLVNAEVGAKVGDGDGDDDGEGGAVTEVSPGDMGSEGVVEVLPPASSSRWQALLLVFDASAPDTFREVVRWCERNESRLDTFEVRLCVANKAELARHGTASSPATSTGSTPPAAAESCSVAAEAATSLLPAGATAAPSALSTSAAGEGGGVGDGARGQGDTGWVGQGGACGGSDAAAATGGGLGADGHRENMSQWKSWCVDNGVEYVETCAVDERLDRELWSGDETEGVTRVREALWAHMWPNMSLLPREPAAWGRAAEAREAGGDGHRPGEPSGAPSEARHESSSAAPPTNASQAAAEQKPQTNVLLNPEAVLSLPGEEKEGDGDDEGLDLEMFEKLMMQAAEMHRSSSSLPDQDRRARAAQLATRMMQLLGGGDDWDGDDD
eukprot:jgi/Mesvir1/1609/Mv14572-RA.1